MSTAERIEALGGIGGLVRDVEAAWEDEDAERTRAITTAAFMVCRYAPDAPDAVTREAIARCAGWLRETPVGNLEEEEVGDQRAKYQPSQMSALRNSGAMALLNPWKVRRAGRI